MTDICPIVSRAGQPSNTSCLLKSNHIPLPTLMRPAGSESLSPFIPRHIQFQFPGEYRWVLDRSVLP